MGKVSTHFIETRFGKECLPVDTHSPTGKHSFPNLVSMK